MANESNMSKEELKQAKKDAKRLLKKPFYKKWWVWVIVIIIIIAVSSGGEDTPVENASDTNSEEKVEVSTEPKVEPVEEVKVASIGEVVLVGGVEFTVNSISTATNVGGEYGVDAQGTFLLLDTTVKNVGTEAITTDSSFFKLLSGEKTYEADGSAGIYANPDTNFFLEQVNPDLSATGIVVFDVSDEVIANPELLLQVQTGLFGTETGTIKIGK